MSVLLARNFEYYGYRRPVIVMLYNHYPNHQRNLEAWIDDVSEAKTAMTKLKELCRTMFSSSFTRR